jgi:phosphotransferase system  glucose/maltose/N-acetylglucosamine-specific IIC component
MTIGDILTWIWNLKIIYIIAVIFLIIVIYGIFYSIYIYFAEKEQRRKNHEENLKNEHYRERYLKEKRAKIIFTSIFVLIGIIIPFIIIVFT